MRDPASLDDTLRRLAREVEEHLSVHPEPESLLAHRRGELPPPEADELEEHLAWCRDCASIWRDLPLFFEGEAEPFDPEERAADWRALEERLASEPPAAEDEPSSDAHPSSRARLASGLAAALAIALGGAALWIVHLSDRLEDSRRPRANVPIHDLAPPAAERTGEAPPLSIELDRNVVLILNSRAELGDRLHEARILTEEGAVVWTIGGLEPSRFGNVTLELPRGSLSPGLYRILLQGEDGGPAAGEYTLRVVEAPLDSAGS